MSHTVLPRAVQSRTSLLNLEHSSNHARSSLNPAGATLLKILGVVGRDDVLARHGVIHHRLSVWEEAIEAPVENAGGDERVQVADVETARAELSARLQPSCA